MSAISFKNYGIDGGRTDTPAYYTPHVLLCQLGRERPGFDQEWGQKMVRAAVACVKEIFPALYCRLKIRTPHELHAVRASPRLSEIDVVIVMQPTIADGRLIMPLAEWASDMPIVLWATPERGDTSEVSSNSLVGTHLFASTLRQLGVQAGFVYGDPMNDRTAHELRCAVSVGYTARRVRRARIGLIGDHAPGFTDLHVDPRRMLALCGGSVESIALHEYIDTVQSYSERDVRDTIAEIDAYHIPCHAIKEPRAMLAQQARFMRAYRHFIAQRSLDALAVRCWPEIPRICKAWPYLATSILQSAGVPIAIEGDVDGALDMLITLSMGHGNSYLTDWLSHEHHRIILWHGGAIPLELCEREHGTPGAAVITTHFNNSLPAVIEAVVAPHKKMTLFRHWQCDGKYWCSAVECLSALPEHLLRGTTCRLESPDIDVGVWFRKLLRMGCPHHFTVAPGHICDHLRELCYHLKWEWVAAHPCAARNL